MGKKREGDDRIHGVVWGLFLIAFGIVFLLIQQGYLDPDLMYDWWKYWPLVLVVLGAVRLARPKEPGDVGGGVTMILFGLWFFANWFEWYGLTWRNSWPLALVAVGAGMVAKAVASAVWRDRDASSAQVVESAGAHVEVKAGYESSGKEEPRV